MLWKGLSEKLIEPLTCSGHHPAGLLLMDYIFTIL